MMKLMQYHDLCGRYVEATVTFAVYRYFVTSLELSCAFYVTVYIRQDKTTAHSAVYVIKLYIIMCVFLIDFYMLFIYKGYNL